MENPWGFAPGTWSTHGGLTHVNSTSMLVERRVISLYIYYVVLCIIDGDVMG
jgi:hypothetical protein